MDALLPQSFTDKLGKTFTPASTQSENAESMAPRFEFSSSTSWDSSKRWSQEAGDHGHLPTESTAEARRGGHGGLAAAPSGRRIGRRQAARRFAERAKEGRKPSGTTSKHEKRLDTKAAYMEGMWPSGNPDDGAILEDGELQEDEQLQGGNPDDGAPLEDGELQEDEQLQGKEFEKVLKQVEADWACAQRQDDLARSQKNTNSLTLRYLTRFCMNVVYRYTPDYEYKDADWERFEGEIYILAGYWGVSVSALKQLHRRGEQQDRFNSAAHNRGPYDQARGALDSSKNPVVIKTLKAIFKDLHGRSAESVRKE